jgi:hypothetical protein
MGVLFLNNATTLTSALITDSQTTIDVDDASDFPAVGGADYCYLTLATPGTVEIIKVTSISVNELTVERGADNTSGYAFPAGSICELRVTTIMLNDALTETIAGAAASAAAALTSENNAETAETGALAAQTAAEAALDTFDDRFLGTFSTAAQPTLDNDGNALIDGAIYFDTTLNTMMTYDLGGAAWLGMKPTSAEQTNIDIVAADSADIATVAADGADIGIVAGDTADIQALGPISADITTAAGISGNITTVAGDSANITIVAGDTADIQLLGPISTDITGVAAIVADVSTAAANVADITNFADVYQGGKASDPATRNDASALQEGDLYFHTGNDELMIYDSAAWAVAAITTAAATAAGAAAATEQAIVMAIALG